MSPCLRIAVIVLLSLAPWHDPLAGNAPSPTVRVRNPPPGISFDLFEADADGNLTLPVPVAIPPFPSSPDENGVLRTRVGEAWARHIGAISQQAAGISNSDIDLDAALRQEQPLTPSQRAALGWLQNNAVAIDDNAVVWHYTFDYVWNNIVIKAGWPSSFAQADVIKALILAYRKTDDKSFLQLAVRAGYAFTVPCETGGLRCEVGGLPWYEELPIPYGYAPMVLNGHLYAVVMLRHLYELTQDERIGGAFRDGVASASKMLLAYDTGYWSSYALRPRETTETFALKAAVDDQEPEIHEIVLSSPVGAASALRLAPGATSTYQHNIHWDAGWGAATAWGRKLSGIGRINLQIGRMTVDHDPVHLGEKDITLAYRSTDCRPPALATLDYRGGHKDYMQLPAAPAIATSDGCSTRYLLRPAIDQWSQVTRFYHEWHTKLVTELWRMTREPLLYAFAVRWRMYRLAEEKQHPADGAGSIAVPVFVPSKDPEADAVIMQALDNADPAGLDEGDVQAALEHWVSANPLGEAAARKLFARAGLMRRVRP